MVSGLQNTQEEEKGATKKKQQDAFQKEHSFSIGSDSIVSEGGTVGVAGIITGIMR